MLYNSKSPACNDHVLFVDELKKTLVPPSSKLEIKTQLLCLWLWSRSVWQFASEFCTLAAKLSWGSDVLHSVFIEGLADYIQDEMTGGPKHFRRRSRPGPVDRPADPEQALPTPRCLQPPPASSCPPSPPSTSGAASNPAAKEPM